MDVRSIFVYLITMAALNHHQIKAAEYFEINIRTYNGKNIINT